MTYRTEFPRKVVEWPDVRIEMPDGIKLSARVWLPEDAEDDPVPAILEHLPYRKRDGTIARDELNHPYLAGHGYACIRVDMRGNGDSEGLMEDEYTQQEWDDAIAVMEWVGAQPWSTGRWGMMGISWGGFNGLQVAALRPEGLDAVISLCTTSDRYADDIHYKGGCLLGENLGWAAQMLSYSSRPPDPMIVGDSWRDMWLERLNAQPFLLETWLDHQTRDAYWQHGSICEDWDAINAAVLVVGGWHDGYRNTPAKIVESLHSPAKAIVGPWIHKYPHFAAPEPRIGFLQEALRWWDRWLKDIDTGVEDDPSQRLWLMDGIGPERYSAARPGRWIALDDPVPMQTLHLTEHQLSSKEGQLDRYVLSPQSCGAGTGEYFPFAFSDEFPGDQQEDDDMSACFDANTSESHIDIVGAPKVDLRLIPEGNRGLIALRLCDVHPDGTSVQISHGFLNLSHHKSHADPVELTPGDEISVSVTLDQCAYRLHAGHKLRLAISTSYWPFIWPSPDRKGITLKSGRLDLPQRADDSESLVTFPEPESAPPWQMTALRAASLTRNTEKHEDGSVVTTIVTDDGKLRDDTHGLITDAICEETWTIHPDDPLCASGHYLWNLTHSRGDWSIRTRSEAWLHADKDAFYPRAKLEAWEGEKKVFEREFRRKIPRNGV